MSRRATPKGTENTKGYDKAKRQKNKLQRKIARKRRDNAFKWAKMIIDFFGIIAIEDYKHSNADTGVKVANRNINRKTYDGAIGITKQILASQATRKGRTVVLVDPKDTTQRCSACGARAKTTIELKT
jgi:putative transposase